MNIFNLPSIEKLAHLSVQYFNNEKKQGVAEHVIKVEYQVRNARKPELKTVIYPVTGVLRNVNRNAKKQMDAAGAAEVKATAKAFKQQGRAMLFGFRQVTTTEKTAKGGRLFHRKQDGTNYVWAEVKPTGIDVTFFWEGATFSVFVTPHESITSQNQSCGIGYFDIRAHIAANISDLQKNNENDQAPTIDDGHSQRRGVEASQGDARAESAACEGTRGSESPAPCAAGIARPSQPRSDDTCAVEQLARVDRHATPDCVGEHDPVQLGAQAPARTNKPRKPAQAAKPRTVRGVAAHIVEARRQHMVDRDEWGTWQPDQLCEAPTGLGTSLRF